MQAIREKFHPFGALEGHYTTLGTRFASKASTALDYKAELAFQFGNRLAVGNQLDIAAVAAHAGLGYTLRDIAWQPRIGVSYDYASGDRDRTDTKSSTFRTP